MLQHLCIQNYTIIHHLEVDFREGFTVITGETGAGKSILLDALALVLGGRADTSVLRYPEKKSVVEAHFRISQMGLEPFFEQNDIDYDELCIIRREISPQGKSRAFINDTPVSLHLLQQLTGRLVDIHSQHANLLLQDKHFQLQMIDQSAHIQAPLKDYQQDFRQYLQLQQARKQLQEKHALQDLDYLSYLFQELQAAKLQAGEQQQLEEKLEELNHATEIKQHLYSAFQLLAGEEENLISRLKEVFYQLQYAQRYQKDLAETGQRMDSLLIELEDLAGEINRAQEKMDYQPESMAKLEERLDLLYNLQQKHHVNDEAGLLEKADEIGQQLRHANEAGEEEEKLKREIEALELRLQQKADALHRQRAAVLPMIEAHLERQLQHMHMPHAKITVSLQQVPLNANGGDEAVIRFSANAGVAPQPIAKIASGGEMSRVMLAIKTLIAEKNVLPTILFDEIDNGVSGEVSARMGEIMRDIARFSQVIAITHQAQIASKGDQHYMVYKETRNGETFSNIKVLDKEENLHEIAKMISDGRVTDSSLQMAESLVKNKSN